MGSKCHSALFLTCTRCPRILNQLEFWFVLCYSGSLIKTQWIVRTGCDSLNADSSPSYLNPFHLQNKGKTKMYWVKHDKELLNTLCTGPLISVLNYLNVISVCIMFSLCTYPVLVCLSVCVFTYKQTEVASGSMKRSASTVGDQRVNGLWQEEKSPERVYRPRHKSYKAAGSSTHLFITAAVTLCMFLQTHYLLLFCHFVLSAFLYVCPLVSRSEHWQQGDRERGRSKERCHLLSPDTSRCNSEERSLQPSRSSSVERAHPQDKQVSQKNSL